MVSIVFVTERKYIYLTDCVYSVGEAVPVQLTPQRFKILHSSAWQRTFLAVSRRLPNIPFASFDRYDRIPPKEPTFRQESRYSGKKVYIPAEASSSRWAESFRGSD
jgi:hypothetical protein